MIVLASLQFPSHALDLDGDGMSDVWQRVHGITTADRDSDADGDGYANWEEEAFGANPSRNGAVEPDGLHGMSNLSTDLLAGGGVIAVISIPSQIGITYRVERRLENGATPGPWTQVGSVIVGDGDPEPILVPDSTAPLIAGTAHQYRVVALRETPIDLDQDGLDAFEEFLLGTSDTLADTDGDGSTDAFEFLNLTDPATSDATLADGDADGTLDESEPAQARNPIFPDHHDLKLKANISNF